MLVPIQTSGAMPPLFAIHSMNGIMNIGSSLAKALGRDQPIYAIMPDGWTGREPVTTSMEAMISAYVAQVWTALPLGPVRILSLCGGSLAAIELVRALQQQGRLVGAPILIDPPPVIAGFNKQTHAIDPRQPAVAIRMREQTRDALLKYAANSSEALFASPQDPIQFETAVTAGAAVHIAMCRHVPKPYPGPTQLIVSADRAAQFFHPQMHWHHVLPSPRMVHVMPWDHREIFRSGREHLMRSVKYMLDASPPPTPLVQQVPGPAG
jgi:thioesterase domain-containing protein